MTELEQIQFYTESILNKSHELGYNVSFIKKCIEEATRLHKDQLRKSGAPYIVHPLGVAYEIIQLNLGEDSIAGALLHDTIEDCGIDQEYLEHFFNSTVANLVEGVTKLNTIADNSTKRYTEILNVRKLLISSSNDIRILLIKLADRLHNMRTIDAMKPERQIEYADETLKVYVPLAEYIGIGKWKRELEDIALQKTEPATYALVKNKLESQRAIQQHILDGLLIQVESVLKAQGITPYKLYGRIKSVHSTYKKFLKQVREGKTFDTESIDLSKIKDLLAISIILDSNEIDCYRVLGLVHAHFEHSSKDFNDYIAKPKPNGYRSLQTTVYYNGTTAEIQIKTCAMHEINEYGTASHLAYKLSGKRNTTPTTQYAWVKHLNTWNEADNSQYEINAFSDKIFVITPKGRVIEMEKGSRPIDFAYRIHSQVGNNYIGAKVNDQIVKIDYELQNGDVVDILTSKTPKKPSEEWIKQAFLASTRQKIKRFVYLHEKDEHIENGKSKIADYVYQSIKLDWLTLDSSTLKYLWGEFGRSDIDQFYTDIHFNKITRKEVLKKLIHKLNIQQVPAKKVNKVIEHPVSKTNILIEGIGDLDYKIAGCCLPIKGDEIVGIITFKDGLKIHRKQCPNLDEIEEKRVLAASWI